MIIWTPILIPQCSVEGNHGGLPLQLARPVGADPRACPVPTTGAPQSSSDLRGFQIFWKPRRSLASLSPSSLSAQSRATTGGCSPTIGATRRGRPPCLPCPYSPAPLSPQSEGSPQGVAPTIGATRREGPRACPVPTVRRPSALSPQSSVLSPQSSVLSPQSSALSPQSSVLSPQPSVLSPQPSSLFRMRTRAPARCSADFPGELKKMAYR